MVEREKLEADCLNLKDSTRRSLRQTIQVPEHVENHARTRAYVSHSLAFPVSQVFLASIALDLDLE